MGENGTKGPKSLADRSSFPHGRNRPRRKMSFLSSRVVDSQKGRPYNPPIADDRGAERGQGQKQATEIKKQFSVSGFRVSD